MVLKDVKQLIKKQKRSPSKYPNLKPLWLAIFSDIIGFSLLIAVTPNFTTLFGITYLQVSLIASANGLFSFISAPIWGKLSDKYGRKPLLQISQVGTLLGFVILAFAGSYEMIIISRIVDGIFGGNFPIAKASINDIVEPKDMAREMTNMGIAHNLANLFAPALGGFLYVQFGLIGPGLAAAFTSIFTLTLTFLKYKESAPIKTGVIGYTAKPKNPDEGGEGPPIPDSPPQDQKQWYKNPSLVRALTILAFSSFGFMTLISNMANFAYAKFSLDATSMGLLLMLTAVVQIISRFTIYMPLLKKWGEYRLALIGFVLYLTVFLAFFILTELYQFIIILVFFSLATSATRGSVSSFISNLANPWERGKVQGIASSLDTFAQIIGPLIGGALLTYIDLRWFTSVSFGFMLIALVLLVSATGMRRELSLRNENFHKILPNSHKKIKADLK